MQAIHMALSPKSVQGTQLVVCADPDPVTRELVALCLEPLGYTVQQAEDIQALVDTLQRRTVQPSGVTLIYSEGAFAEADGAQQAKLKERLVGVRSIALLEPGAPPEPRHQWIEPRYLLTKPVQLDALLRAVRGQSEEGSLAGSDAMGEASQDGRLVGFLELVREMEMDAAMVKELVSSFLDRAPGYVSTVESGLQQRKLDQADRAAHTMKGMCGNLRFDTLVRLSDTLRRAAQAGDLDGAGQRLQELKDELGLVSAGLRRRWPMPE